jgi:hypothetical protein
MAEQFQKAIGDLTREEAQAEVREAWDAWHEMDDLRKQARDWAVAANSLRVAALEALEEIRKVAEDAGCNLPHPSGIPCGDCGSCRTLAILGESE